MEGVVNKVEAEVVGNKVEAEVVEVTLLMAMLAVITEKAAENVFLKTFGIMKTFALRMKNAPGKS